MKAGGPNPPFPSGVRPDPFSADPYRGRAGEDVVADAPNVSGNDYDEEDFAGLTAVLVDAGFTPPDLPLNGR